MIININNDRCLKSDIVRLFKGGGSSLFGRSNALTHLYGEGLLYIFRITREAHVQSGLFFFTLGP